jgi:hypothetical protein
MTSDKENLTARESLDLISSMIAQTKGNVDKNSFYFLLWGWTILLANLGVYTLIVFADVKNPFMVWAITIPAAIVSGIYGARQEKNAVVSTHLDVISKWLWIGFGISTFIVVFFGKMINYQINPVISTLAAVPTFVSGVLLKFKPLKFGGIAFWILGIASFLVHNENQFLISALAIALGYLVPGYMLRARKA